MKNQDLKAEGLDYDLQYFQVVHDTQHLSVVGRTCD